MYNAEFVGNRRWRREKHLLGAPAESQMLKVLLVAAFIGLVLPALAADRHRIRSDGYHVAHKVNDKVCVVFQRKPVGSAWIMVGATSYKFIAEAAAVMRSAPECTK
jgi:hypothetical protein